MTTWSQFAEHYLKTAGHVPMSKRYSILAEAKSRYAKKMKLGRADSCLCFRDLVDQLDKEIDR